MGRRPADDVVDTFLFLVTNGGITSGDNATPALKAGKLAEAQALIKDALRLGTRDAKLFYHAGMIARAAGDSASARDYLKRALKLSPEFDPLHAVNARKTLDNLNE